MMADLNQRVKGKDKIRGYSQLDFYAMSKPTLIKNIQILVHELKIYHRLEENQNQFLKKDNVKGQIQNQIIVDSYRQNQEKLRSRITLMEHECSKLESTIKEKDIEMSKLIKQVDIYRKKAEQFDRVGGKVKVAKLEELNKNFKQQKQELIKENQKLKKQLMAANNKCKILEQLNRETELQVANQLIQNKSKKIPANLNERNPSEKQNDSALINAAISKQNTIELYALKEQVKLLREQLRVSEERKQKLSNKINERQLFYSKMIKSNY